MDVRNANAVCCTETCMVRDLQKLGAGRWTTPTFALCGRVWRMEVIEELEGGEEELARVSLMLCGDDDAAPVHASCTVINVHSEVTASWSNLVFMTGMSWHSDQVDLGDILSAGPIEEDKALAYAVSMHTVPLFENRYFVSPPRAMGLATDLLRTFDAAAAAASDVQFVNLVCADEQVVRVHRFILAARAPRVDAGSLDLSHAPARTVRALARYLYGGALAALPPPPSKKRKTAGADASAASAGADAGAPFDLAALKGLCDLAETFRLDELVAECEQTLLGSLGSQSMADVLDLLRHCGDNKRFRACCVETIATSPAEAIALPGFAALDPDVKHDVLVALVNKRGAVKGGAGAPPL